MGLKTGFEDLDRVITGLNKSDLIIIGARPSMGKTSFALNLARNVSVKGRKRVLFFSLEMSREQLAQRLLSTGNTCSEHKNAYGILLLTSGRISRLLLYI